MATSLAELRDALARRFPDALPLSCRTALTVAMGIDELDGMLPNGGLPRGRLTVWAPGGGATAVLRAACVTVSGRGERAAWVDAAGTVAQGWPAEVLLLRPAGERDALVCAEELLRSGGFALVVLGGTSKAAEREAVRLSRAAKEGGSAFVVVTAESVVASLRLRSRLPPEAYRWRRNSFGEPAEVEAVRVEVEAASLGWSGRTSFALPVLARPVRLALDPLLVDRRGVLRKPYRPRRSGWARPVIAAPPSREGTSLAASGSGSSCR
jgi:hypothetical protein